MTQKKSTEVAGTMYTLYPCGLRHRPAKFLVVILAVKQMTKTQNDSASLTTNR